LLFPSSSFFLLLYSSFFPPLLPLLLPPCFLMSVLQAHGQSLPTLLTPAQGFLHAVYFPLNVLLPFLCLKIKAKHFVEVEYMQRDV
jgi:hypothetical protein